MCHLLDAHLRWTGVRHPRHRQRLQRVEELGQLPTLLLHDWILHDFHDVVEKSAQTSGRGSDVPLVFRQYSRWPQGIFESVQLQNS